MGGHGTRLTVAQTLTLTDRQPWNQAITLAQTLSLTPTAVQRQQFIG